MSDYRQEENRWTMVLIRKKLPDGSTVTERATFDLVRFNVDTDPKGRQYVSPIGNGSDTGKVFERIWTVDEAPFKVQFFGDQS